MLASVLSIQAKYDQHQAAHRSEVLPYTRSTSELKSLAPGTSHFTHSKSDGNFLNGHAEGATNGHLLLQEWEATDGFTLIPLSDYKGTESVNIAPSVVRSSVKSVNNDNSSLHSRTVFHV